MSAAAVPAIRDAIEHCASGMDFVIGQTIGTKPGNTLGPEKQGIDSLFDWDPDYDAISNPTGVRYDAGTNTVTGGCAASGTCACPSYASECPYGGTMSPRIVQAAICDPLEADCAAAPPGRAAITITNILSFFITGYSTVLADLIINAVIIGSAGRHQARARASAPACRSSPFAHWFGKVPSEVQRSQADLWTFGPRQDKSLLDYEAGRLP